MELDELMSKTPSELEHYGVPGMKWGRRKARAVSTRVKEEVASKKREYSWKKQYKNRSNMSTKDLQKLNKRVANENQLKRNATTKAQKKAYRNRATMSDQRLNALVKRVNLEANFKQQATAVRKADRKKAKQLINQAADLPLSATPHGAALQGALKLAGSAL